MPNAILENKEPVIGLGEVARSHNIHTATITRWITHGSRSATGTRVRLEGIRKGCKWVTSEAAVLRFFERLSVMGPEEPQQPEEKPAARRKAIADATREMEAAGA